MLSLWLATFVAKGNRSFPAMIAARCKKVILVASLIVALPAQGSTVFSQVSDVSASLQTINSSVTIPDSSDQDTTTFDNFTLSKSARITSVTWRGSSADYASAGFVIKIYTSPSFSTSQAERSNPLAEITETGNANEKLLGKNLSDYRADFAQPVELSAGKQFWISIVSMRNAPSTWGWSNGSGGDGKSIQSFSEVRILPALNDRAFSLLDGNGGSPKK
jgi:hypothetical protein